MVDFRRAAIPAPLSVARDWDLDVTIRVSAFDQYETVIQVPGSLGRPAR